MMKNSKWIYKQTQSIKNYSDLNRELERAELHQKFLLEIMDNDKELLKKAYSLPNVLQSGIMSLTSGKEDSGINKILDNNVALTIFKWIVSKVF